MRRLCCIACGSELTKIEGHVLNEQSNERVLIPVRKCTNCGHFFTEVISLSDSKTAGENSTMTTEAYICGMITAVTSMKDRYRELARNRADFYRRILGKSKLSILEIGAGAGGG